jgi:hypothetical protein
MVPTFASVASGLTPTPPATTPTGTLTLQPDGGRQLSLSNAAKFISASEANKGALLTLQIEKGFIDYENQVDAKHADETIQSILWLSKFLATKGIHKRIQNIAGDPEARPSIEQIGTVASIKGSRMVVIPDPGDPFTKSAYITLNLGNGKRWHKGSMIFKS